MLLPGSSHFRSAIAYILISAAALLFLNIYAPDTIRRMTFRSEQEALEAKALLISTALLELDNLSAEKVEQAILSLNDLQATRIIVTDPAGYALYDSLPVGNAQDRLVLFPEVVSALGGNDVFFGSYAAGAVESHTAIPVTRGGVMLGAVYLMEHNTDQGALIAALQTNILRISIGLEAAIILFALFFSIAFSGRVRKILHSVQMMRSGDYSQKVAVHKNDELARLGREFNELAERLNASEERRRQFVSDASHEFKTPLASIKLLSDSLLQNEMDQETEREFIGDIGREADRLGRLSQKLLTLTRLDSSVDEEREIIDPMPTVQKVLRMLRPLAELRSIRLEGELQTGCLLMTVEDDFYQVVFNLTENAIKYNHEGGWVRLCLFRQGDDVVLSVTDNGAGIPEAARAHIFERFYRVDKARSRAAGGSGLGLSIVHNMVERNYGAIQVDGREPEPGSVFTVTFPFFDPQEDL